MGFRKKNAKRSDNRSSAKVIMGKPASKLTKEEKKILSARMAEIRSENGGKSQCRGKTACVTWSIHTDNAGRGACKYR